MKSYATSNSCISCYRMTHLRNLATSNPAGYVIISQLSLSILLDLNLIGLAESSEANKLSFSLANLAVIAYKPFIVASIRLN